MWTGFDPDFGTENWPVCRTHYRRMVFGGVPWKTARGGTGSFRRWILMGDNLASNLERFPPDRPTLDHETDPPTP